MNLYIRYFQNEVIVKSVEEACDFLSSIPDIHLDEYMVNELQQFYASNECYPRRYKVRGKSYFIVIKTPLETLEQFHAEGEKKRQDLQVRTNDKKERAEAFQNIQIGWYEASLTFKRVITIPETQKFQYSDTTFKARLKAISVQDCYNRIVDHLRSRGDVDPRSQFPSIRKKDFHYVFLGLNPESKTA